MEKETKKNLISNEHTFLELPIEKYEFYDDPEVKKYIFELDFESLGKSEIKELLSKKDSDKKTRERLIKNFMHLPIILASKYSNITTLSNIDLIMEGNMGLMEAVDNYNNSNLDYETFYKYLVKKVRKSIINSCIKTAKSASISESIYSKLLKINETQDKLEKEYGRVPEDEEIFVELEDFSDYLHWKWSKDGIKFNGIKDLRYELKSIDAIDKDKETGGYLIIDLDRTVELSIIKDIILNAIKESNLNDKEKYILMSLYGFIKEKTTKELSDELKVPMSTIYRLEKTALKKIKKQVYYKLDGFRDNPMVNKQR